MKAYNALMAVRSVADSFRMGASRAEPRDTALSAGAPSAATGPLEARLANVVVAALKEAFDRDHARLELERAQLEEERRRAEEALRLEMRRQAVDREVTRLRFIGGAALVAWMASVFVLGPRALAASVAAKVVLGTAWTLLLAALAAAFVGQERVGATMSAREADNRGSSLALYLMIAGLALTAASLLIS
jgi:hypothetical protein